MEYNTPFSPDMALSGTFFSHRNPTFPLKINKSQKNWVKWEMILEKVVLLHPAKTKSYGGQGLLQTI